MIPKLDSSMYAGIFLIKTKQNVQRIKIIFLDYRLFEASVTHFTANHIFRLFRMTRKLNSKMHLTKCTTKSKLLG